MTTSTESRASTIARLRASLARFTEDVPHGGVIAQEPEYQQLVEVFSGQDVPARDVIDYALGGSWVVAHAALQALERHRPDGDQAIEPVLRHLTNLDNLVLAQALRLLATHLPPAQVGRPLILFVRDGEVSPYGYVALQRLEGAFAAYFAALAARGVTVKPDPITDDIDMTRARCLELHGFLRRVPHPQAMALSEALDVPPAPEAPLSAPVAEKPPDAPPPAPAEPGFFDKVGRFWSADEAKDLQPVPEWQAHLAAARAALNGRPPRSVLVVGDSMVGKSAFLKLLGRTAGKEGWRVFEADANDFLADNIYIGQTEGLVRQARQALAVAKRIAWHVPDLLGLAQSGANRSNTATILDQFLPAITTGELILWAEATPQAADRLLRLRPALRRSLDVIRLEPLDVGATHRLASALTAALGAAGGVQVAPSVPMDAIDAARHYLTASCLPGAALRLLREVMRGTERAPRTTVTGDDVLGALSQATGLPKSLLDGSERLDLQQVSAFFSARVIGQSDAVRRVVERVAMLKAGLNDPGKPLGVFLFAGPTGTGKTELAKAISEFLFGTAGRMVRLDMSEFQASDSLAKLVGGPYNSENTDTLTDRVRRQPYSVLLLDEFEKAHPAVWDLCLQLLDEGRLTDYTGQTADFRNCLIILTTNLGATTHQTSGLGFAPAQGAYNTDQVMRAIGDVFRPEFQNRLDDVVVFKPLTRELMRGILTKELARLYQRRGLQQRDWAIEWEASAIEFLLEKGFNAEMGARPLKRAIDRYVAAPLAAVIVERRAPDQEQFVFMRSDGTAIQAEFIDPDADDDDPDGRRPARSLAQDAPSLEEIALAPEGTRAELDVVAAAQARIAERVEAPEWGAAKLALADEVNAAGFWDRPDRVQVLTRFELMDRLAVAAETAASLRARLARHRGAPGRAGREAMARLAVQVRVVQEGLRDLDESAPVEVALAVEPALDGRSSGGPLAEAWRRDVNAMYAGWCRRRSMLHAEVAVNAGALPLVHVVSGFGAHRALMAEAGLHLFEHVDDSGASVRVAARVLVVVTPAEEGSDAVRRARLAAAFATAPRPATVVRRYRRKPSPLVRSGDGAWRTGRLDAVLGGDFDLVARVSSAAGDD